MCSHEMGSYFTTISLQQSNEFSDINIHSRNPTNSSTDSKSINKLIEVEKSEQHYSTAREFVNSTQSKQFINLKRKFVRKTPSPCSVVLAVIIILINIMFTICVPVQQSGIDRTNEHLRTTNELLRRELSRDNLRGRPPVAERLEPPGSPEIQPNDVSSYIMNRWRTSYSDSSKNKTNIYKINNNNTHLHSTDTNETFTSNNYIFRSIHKKYFPSNIRHRINKIKTANKIVNSIDKEKLVDIESFKNIFERLTITKSIGSRTVPTKPTHATHFPANSRSCTLDIANYVCSGIRDSSNTDFVLDIECRDCDISKFRATYCDRVEEIPTRSHPQDAQGVARPVDVRGADCFREIPGFTLTNADRLQNHRVGQIKSNGSCWAKMAEMCPSLDSITALPTTEEEAVSPTTSRHDSHDSNPGTTTYVSEEEYNYENEYD